MTGFAHDGITVDLPGGWDAQMRRAGGTARRVAGSAAAATDVGEGAGTVLHAASFALPAERGDYGSGAVEVMGGSDILICLLEHEPEAAGTALFARHGIPRLDATMFSPQSMQRAVAGMCGTQHFFQVSGRPFCLYVVLGSWHTREPLVRAADQVTRTLRIVAPA